MRARRFGGPEWLVVAFAFLYNFPCGLHFFVGTDSEHYFDAGFRILNGQLPYRDFFSPTGPILYFLIAAAFKLLGVSYLVYVGVASLMNAAITACTLAGCRALGAERRLALAAGLAAAIFNLPIERGTPWYDTGAFLFLHAALWLLLAPPSALSGRASTLAAGAATALAFHSKQSTGTVAAAALTLYLWQAASRGWALRFAASFAGAAAVLTVLWMALGQPELLLRYFFVLPLGSGYLQHAAQGLSPWLSALLALAGWRLFKSGEWLLWLPNALLLPHALSTRLVSAYYFAPLLALPFLESRRERALLMALTVIQYGSRILSFGETYTYWTFIGLYIALLGNAFETMLQRGEGVLGKLARPLAWLAARSGLLLVILLGIRYSLLRKLSYQWQMFSLLGAALAVGGTVFGAIFLWAAVQARRERWVALGLATLVCLATAGLGLRQSVSTWRLKRSHLPAMDLSAQRTVRIPKLSPLKVSEIQAAHLEAVAEYLRAPERRPFFVYPSHMIFYGVLGQLAPQPFLWFTPDLTFRTGPPDESRLCSALAANGVRTVAVYDGATRLAEFPCLAEWLQQRFQLDRLIGPVHLYRFRKAKVPLLGRSPAWASASSPSSTPPAVGLRSPTRTENASL